MQSCFPDGTRSGLSTPGSRSANYACMPWSPLGGPGRRKAVRLGATGCPRGGTEDPLRESAAAAVIAVHLCERNTVEAVRYFNNFAGRLRTELASRRLRSCRCSCLPRPGRSDKEVINAHPRCPGPGSVFNGSTAAAAARESVLLAMELERLGFTRFWVAEHHSDQSRACAAPEVISASIAAHTDLIRVGAGCVLLPYSSPLRTAEQYRLLEALAPGRADIGVGRGSGPPTRQPESDSLLSR